MPSRHKAEIRRLLLGHGCCSGSCFASNYPELFPGVAAGGTMTEAIKAVKQISGTDEA